MLAKLIIYILLYIKFIFCLIVYFPLLLSQVNVSEKLHKMKHMCKIRTHRKRAMLDAVTMIIVVIFENSFIDVRGTPMHSNLAYFSAKLNFCVPYNK